MVFDGNRAPKEEAARVQVLDLLRLVAVLGVVLYHYGFRGPNALGMTHVALPELSSFARYGFLGVPVFFVISGFVIAYSAEGRSALVFSIARFARIYPTFIFCMTLTSLATLLFGLPAFETSLGQWAANFLIAAPALGRPYMDSAYWSLVYEVTFYAWVAVLIATGAFRRRIDLVIVLWLAISLLNELTLASVALRKIFLTDVSGFFAAGILIFELHRGRRDVGLQCLLALSVACAITMQSIYNLPWLREHTGASFDDWVVAAICLASIVVIMWATRIRRLPISGSLVRAIGGMTYPFYLLHQQVGYDVLNRIGPNSYPMIFVAVIVCSIALLSWAVWHFIERPCQKWTKQSLTELASMLKAFGKSRPATS